jgi:hypothetical protein
MGTTTRLQPLVGSFLLALAVLTMLAACGTNSSVSKSSGTSTGSTGTSAVGCVAEVREINGVNTRSFCGPATATATVGGQQWSWTQGQCFNESGMVGVNIGRVILGTDVTAQQLKKQYDYFGVTVQASKDGTYPGTAIAGEYHGQDLTIVSGSVTLSSNLSKGSFTGDLFSGGGHVTGSWSC